MSSEYVYKVKIDGDGLTFEREISKEIGEKVLMLILSSGNQPFPIPDSAGFQQTPPLEDTQGTDKHNSDLSIREFLDEHNAKRNPDIITAAGMYLVIHEKKQFFKKEDILNAFESAAEPSPKNFSRDLKWTIKIGWVAEKRGTKDEYYVTSSGKNAVNTAFPAELLKKTKDPFSGKKNSTKKNQDTEA